jgi:hypothetical protein
MSLAVNSHVLNVLQHSLVNNFADILNQNLISLSIPPDPVSNPMFQVPSSITFAPLVPCTVSVPAVAPPCSSLSSADS